jgi:hypothetical protein
MIPKNRLAKRGQKKVTAWYPGSVEPAFAGWYDVLFADEHRVRLYWSEGRWLGEPSEDGFPFVAALRRRRFAWRGIDRAYYAAEIGRR